MSIGLNTSNNIVRDFNSVMSAVPAGKTDSAQASKAGGENEAEAIAGLLNQEGPEINGAEALRNAEVSAFARELRDQVPARHTFRKSTWNVFKFIGRCAMKACHAIRYAFAPAKKSRTQFQEKLQGLHPESYGENAQSRVGTFKAGGSAPTFTCTTEELGAAMGLRGKLRMKPFTAEEIEEIRRGQFKLSDIAQNPNLENCWFLGALCAFLGAKGPGAIQEMISLPPLDEAQDNPVAQVKLGGEIYNVPLAKLRGDGGSGVSTSKPWVNLLETAMQMHLMNLYKFQGAAGMHEGDQPADKVDMSFNDCDMAIATLLGVGISEKNGVRPHVENSDVLSVQTESNYLDPEISRTSVAAIRKALTDGRPVMLVTPASYGLALSTGVSPNHTLAVLDVVVAKDGKAYFQVLDPYGRAVLINADVMKNGGTITMEQDPDPQPHRLQRRNSLASTTARHEADIDGQKANF